MGTAILVAILGGTAWAIYRMARRDLRGNLRLLVCRGHGGDAIDACPLCGKAFCKECQPEGHCIPEPIGPDSWKGNP